MIQQEETLCLWKCLEEDAFCYLISNLSPQTDRDTLWRVLGVFGTIIQLEIKTGQLSKAAVIYK